MPKKYPNPGPELDELLQKHFPIKGQPSSNINDAMKLVDYLVDQDRRTALGSSVFKVDLSRSGYNVGFWIRPADYDDTTGLYRFPGYCGKAKAPTLPHAIVLAALVAAKAL